MLLKKILVQMHEYRGAFFSCISTLDLLNTKAMYNEYAHVTIKKHFYLTKSSMIHHLFRGTHGEKLRICTIMLEGNERVLLVKKKWYFIHPFRLCETIQLQRLLILLSFFRVDKV